MEYKCTANTLSIFVLISVSYCARWWSYKKNETGYLSRSCGDSDIYFMIIVVSIGRDERISTNNRVINLSVYMCVFES